ncbi:MAG: histidine kinase N-terminal 7TM domain-containing protein [Syntrophomonas sp.]
MLSYSYSILTAVAALTSFFLFWYGFKHRFIPGIAYYAALMLAIGTWSLLGSLEMVASSVELKIIFSKIMYLGVVSLPPLWLLFSIEFSNNAGWLSGKRRFLLLLMPLITLFLVFTNEWHGLLWKQISIVSSAPLILAYRHGPWMWINTLYSYILILWGAFKLVKMVLNSYHMLRMQVCLLLTATVIPLLSNIVYLFNVNSTYGLDPTPLAFTFSGILMAWAIFRYRWAQSAPFILENIFKNMPSGIILLDHCQCIVDINPFAMQLFGCQFEVLGKPVGILNEAWPEILQRHELGSDSSLEFVFKQDNYEKNELRCYDLSVSTLYGYNGKPMGWLLLVHDISERKRLERELRVMANTDELTGIANRKAYMELSEQAFRQACRYQRQLTIIIIDVDYLKKVNDTYGHQTGDRALQFLARACSALVRESDIVGRVGGDELAISLPETELEGALRLGERIRFIIESSPVFDEMGNPVHFTISMGIDSLQVGDRSLDELLGRAGQALYQAKNSGRNRICSFKPTSQNSNGKVN